MRRIERWGQASLVLAITIGIWLIGSATTAAEAHQIQPGETLSEIADAYGVPLDALAAQNHILDVNLIYAGEELVVPGQAPPVGPPAPSSTYVVQPGDNLWTIASMRRTTVQQLIAANPEIADPNHIVVNQSVALPSGGSAPAAVPSSGSGNVASLLTHYAGVYGLDAALVQALAWQESGWQQGVVSSAGAVGVMQILPATADWLARDVVGQPLDVVNSTEDNVLAGVAYLRFLTDGTGSTEMAIAAYYQGPGSVQRDGVLPETQRYVANVLAIRSHILLYGTP